MPHLTGVSFGERVTGIGTARTPACCSQVFRLPIPRAFPLSKHTRAAARGMWAAEGL
jgi:hypothetical protein